jgi:hypothetical protein
VRPEHVSDGPVEEDFFDSDFLKKKLKSCWRKWLLCWRHDNQPNATQHCDIPNNDTQQNKIQHNDAKHNETQYDNKK